MNILQLLCSLVYKQRKILYFTFSARIKVLCKVTESNAAYFLRSENIKILLFILSHTPNPTSILFYIYIPIYSNFRLSDIDPFLLVIVILIVVYTYCSVDGE